MLDIYYNNKNIKILDDFDEIEDGYKKQDVNKISTFILWCDYVGKKTYKEETLNEYCAKFEVERRG